MKSLYNISKGQLIVLWFFGVIGWIMALDKSDYGSDLAQFFCWFIPLILIFYTIGWKNHTSIKKDSNENLHGDLFFNKIIRKFKAINFKKIIILLAILGVAGYVFSGVMDNKQEEAEMKEFVGRVGRYSTHLENAKKCQQNLIEKEKPALMASCKKEYNDAYKVYQNCKATMPWSTHYDCVTWPGGNYEMVDCSEETIIKSIKSSDFICYSEITSEYNYLISFEKSIVDKFIYNLPKDQTSLSKEEMDKIYSIFPKEVWTEKMVERIDKYAKSKGYTVIK